MSNKLTVYCDLDGVLLNWCDAALKVAGLDPTDIKIQDLVINDYDAIDKLVGKANMDSKLNQRGWQFWDDLELLPWAKELVEKIRIASKGNLAFLSSPGQWADGAKGKVLWQQRTYPDIPIILCRHKNWVAAPDKFLIDDDPAQVKRFFDGGGIAFKWPSQYELARKTIEEQSHLIDNVCSVIKGLKSLEG